MFNETKINYLGTIENEMTENNKINKGNGYNAGKLGFIAPIPERDSHFLTTLIRFNYGIRQYEVVPA